MADYAAGCPEAVVVLVNYGPVGGDVFRHVPCVDAPLVRGLNSLLA